MHTGRDSVQKKQNKFEGEILKSHQWSKSFRDLSCQTRRTNISANKLEACFHIKFPQKDASKTGSATAAATVLNSNGEIPQELVIGLQYGTRWLVDPEDVRDRIVQPVPQILKRLNVLHKKQATVESICSLQPCNVNNQNGQTVHVFQAIYTSACIYLQGYLYKCIQINKYIHMCTLCILVASHTQASLVFMYQKRTF